MKDYTQILPHGEQNALPAKSLADTLGFSSVRALQRDIAVARANGQVILSSTVGGYYQAANAEEIRRFALTCQTRAMNTFLASRSAWQALQELDKQISPP